MVNAVLNGARRRAALATSLALACGALGATGASAAVPAAVLCHGQVTASTDVTTPDSLDYAFVCTNAIKSYTVISSQPIGSFDVSSTVFDRTTGVIVGPESFACEGLIPGDGFNCGSGQAAAPHQIRGDFETDSPRCSVPFATTPLKVQIVVADVAGNTEGPFALGGLKRCPAPAKKAKAKPKHKSKGHKASAHKSKASAHR
jgi:hypothetical protein